METIGIYRVIADGERVDVYPIGTRHTHRYGEQPRRITIYASGHAECDGPDCWIDCLHLELATR